MVERVGHISVRDDAAEVMVAHHILCQEDEVPSRAVDDVSLSLAVHGFVVVHGVSSSTCTIRLAAHDGLEGNKRLTFLFCGSFEFLIHALAVVQQVLDAVHVSVIG